MKLSEVTSDTPSLKLSAVTAAPEGPDLPQPGLGERVAKAVVPPIVNFLDYPIRAASADIVGAVRGGLPVDEKSRESFYRERDKSLGFAALPETEAGKTISHALSLPGQAIGYGVRKASEAMFGQAMTSALGPAATVAGDVLPFAAARFAKAPASTGALAEPKTFADFADAISKDSPAKIESHIQRLYSRAIKPSVAGKETVGQLERAETTARDAISSVVQNKANLHFIDDKGREIAGELPKSLEQFGEAIDQTKRRVFAQYDAMSREAGVRGAEVPMDATIRELRALASAKHMQDFHPSDAKYAADLADRLEARAASGAGYSPGEAQEAIQIANAKLKAFYAAPKPEGVNHASIDAMVANTLRNSLDDTIERTVAPGYQTLKNQYGALRQVEKEVVKRAIVVGRQEAGGGLLGRIGDVVSAEEILRGVATGQWQNILVGLGVKGTTQTLRYLRGPNRAVQKMFEAAEKHHRQSPAAAPELPPVVPSGMQPPRPTDGAMPAAQPGTPPPPGGTSAGSSALPVMPPQAPQLPWSASDVFGLDY